VISLSLSLFKGFTVFAGFSNKAENEDIIQKLKDHASGRLHVLQLDITNERDIHSTFLYVNENLPDGAPGISPYLLKLPEIIGVTDYFYVIVATLFQDYGHSCMLLLG